MRHRRQTAPRRSRLLALTLILWGCGGREQWRPPETRTAIVTDTMHGVSIIDPYRWLEEQSSPEVLAWIARQEQHADSVLGPASPWRDSIRTRLTELLDVPAVSATRVAAGYEYFTLRRIGEPVAGIYRRPAPAVPTRVAPDSQYEQLVDPLALRPDGTTSVAIEAVSNDGKLLVYSVRDGGPDETSVHIRNLTSGHELPDSLPAALYAGVSLAPDGKGLYFVHRSRSDGPRFRYHAFGTPASADSVLFGAGYGPTAFLAASTVDGGRFRLYVVSHGWARNQVFLQNTRSHEVRDLTPGISAHASPQFVGGTLFMRTDHQAPRGRIVKVDLANPSPDRWVDIVPQGEHTLDAFTVIEDRLYVTWIHDVSHRISVHELSGRAIGDVPVPEHAAASIRGFGKGEALLTLNRFAHPTETWRVNLATGARDLWERQPVPFDTAAFEVRQVWYTSMSGSRAPMYLFMRRGLQPGPTTPVLLSGYGGFAVSLMPRFDARAAWWVEQGGVFAQATLRGGNEYGEAWHRDGMLQNKQHVFDDFIAAAQFLVDSGYTSAAHLAIRGVSNGGLLMGAALTQRPNLFRAAFVGVPDLDMVRFNTFVTHNNLPALLEYGDASRREEFEAIRQYSPYQRIVDGVRYPRVMLQTGMNDTRVPPWQARKFTARLQAATASGEPVILYHDLRSGHAGGRAIAGAIDIAVKEMEFLFRAVRP